MRRGGEGGLIGWSVDVRGAAAIFDQLEVALDRAAERHRVGGDARDFRAILRDDALAVLDTERELRPAFGRGVETESLHAHQSLPGPAARTSPAARIFIGNERSTVNEVFL